MDIRRWVTQRTESLNAAAARGNQGNGDAILASQGVSNNRIDSARTTVESIVLDGSVSLNQQRTGSQQTVNEVINTESLGNRVMNREINRWLDGY